MTKNINYVSHKKSKVKSNGKPQLPLASALVEGEIAVNYAEDVETLSIKNESGNVITFSSDNYYTEQKLGSGFTGENSAKTVTEVIEDNEEVASSALNDLEARKVNTSDVISAITSENSGSTNPIATKVIAENELVISTALNDLNTRKADTSAVTEAISEAVSALSFVSSAVTAMTGYAMAASGTPITSADTLNQAIGKLEKMIDEFKNYIEQKELAIAAALTDLDDRIGNAEQQLSQI